MVNLPASSYASEIKNQLVEMINCTNGLKLNDEAVKLSDEDLLDKLPDVEVPKIGLDSSDSEAEDTSNNNNSIESAETEINDFTRIQITADDITLGLFQDVNDIYESKINELDLTDNDIKISQLELSNFSVVAFKYKDEKFSIYKPPYD